MIDRAIIMLNDRRFWGRAFGPSPSGKTLHRSIHCWHGHAARRSALPRERFSPLAHFGSGATECESPLLGAKRTVPNVAHFARGQGSNLTAYGAQEV
jgi:hypothetical protein